MGGLVVMLRMGGGERGKRGKRGRGKKGQRGKSTFTGFIAGPARVSQLCHCPLCLPNAVATLIRPGASS